MVVAPNDFVKGIRIAIPTSEGTRRGAMLRITVVNSSESAVILRVEGRITGSWVEELRKTCAANGFSEHTFRDGVPLSLELSDVAFADADGIALLKELRSRGVDLMLPTPFIAERLKDGPPLDGV